MELVVPSASSLLTSRYPVVRLTPKSRAIVPMEALEFGITRFQIGRAIFPVLDDDLHGQAP